ncbi:MAG: hypothetical protein ACOH1O_13580, partial [Flavobacterium sp.]
VVAFLLKNPVLSNGVFCFLSERRVRTSSSVRRLSFEKPRSNERGFLFYSSFYKIKAEKSFDETRHALSVLE